MTGKASISGFYGIVDWRGADHAGAERLARQLIAGGARTLQLRMKHCDARDLMSIGAVLKGLCAEQGVLFVINDRLDVAMALQADAVHLGQDDLPLGAARKICGAEMMIGVSTHSEDQARAAADGGADYIGFGPLFATRTKENPDPVVGTVRLGAVCRQLAIPVVAIGGIDLMNVGEVVSAGAHAAAVISAVNGATDPIAAARKVSAAFQ